MSIYFIQAGENGPIKIGVARDCASRLRGLQTGTHADLRLIRQIPGGRQEEMALHRAYGDLRIRGEWFTFCPSMLKVRPKVEERPYKPSRLKSPPPPPTPASDVISYLGGPPQVARITRRTQSAIRNWKRDGIPAKFWMPLLDYARHKRIVGVTRETITWRPSA